MTKKHFEAIAGIIRYRMDTATNEIETQMIEWIADDFVFFLATQNAQFDRERFLEACGVITEGEIDDYINNNQAPDESPISRETAREDLLREINNNNHE